MEVRFNAADHTYTIDGILVPSVTQIIGEWIRIKVGGYEYHQNIFKPTVRIPSYMMEKVAAIGEAIHLGSHYLATGQGVDWDALDPSLVKPLRQFEKWLADYRVEVIASEAVLGSAASGFAGQVDLIVKIDGYWCIPDIKTGKPSFAVGPQTAAYLKMALESGAIPRKSKGTEFDVKRACLKIPKDGSPYQFEMLDKPHNEHDWEFFQCRLGTYNYLQKVEAKKRRKK